MISQETIDDVRRRVSLLDVVGGHVELTAGDKSHFGLCPFHDDSPQSPSFHVNDERGFFYCFGCEASGNVIGFVQRISCLSFPNAVRWLASRHGIDITEAVEAQPDGTDPAPP